MILRECRPIYEYSWFIKQIKNYLADGWSRDDAISQAVKDCLDNGIMVEFMREHGSETVIFQRTSNFALMWRKIPRSCVSGLRQRQKR